jgi:bifunctional enzyme CysN/CysC
MRAAEQAARRTLHGFLLRQAEKPSLRFVTCGSVDDGKSILMGRLLYEAGALLEDQARAVERDSRRYGTAGDNVDYALLFDGLDAERQQGITIDVAYRYFSTDKRRFTIIDTPGHEQFTRNMVTGASNADAAVVLVDARKGILPQTRRHAHIVSLLGVRHVVLAVNKMDQVEYDRQRFETIVAEFRPFAARIGLSAFTAIPLSALRGDNIVRRAPTMPWYQGSALLEWLESVPATPSEGQGFRMWVQWVSRPNQDFRGLAGTVAQGTVCPGDRVSILPSGKTSAVARIVTMDGDLKSASAGDAITLTLSDEIDASRGEAVVAEADPPEQADQFHVALVWMSEEPLLPGRGYLVKIGSRTVVGQVTDIRYRVNVNDLSHLAAKRLELNEIGVVNLSLDRPVPFEAYAKSKAFGGFILIDRLSNATVDCGMIDYALRRSANIQWQHIEVDREARASLMRQKPCVLWFTGLSGSGKSTLANLIEKRLHAAGNHTYLVDGDNVRHGLNKDLGFTPEDRVENVRRVGELARLMADAGLIVLVSLISPFRNERQMARERLDTGEFIEIFVDTPLEECERRDPKGLYRKARAGTLKNFTGIDSPYEAPLNPELVLRTMDAPPEKLVDRVLDKLRRRQIISS